MKFQIIALSISSLFSSVKAEEKRAGVGMCQLSLLNILNAFCNTYYQGDTIADYDTIYDYYNKANEPKPVTIPVSREQYVPIYNAIPGGYYNIYALNRYDPSYYFIN